MSAAIVGLLLFGWPILLFLQSHKQVALFLELATIGSLIFLTILAIITNVFL